jgi:hypothetical protein
MALTRIRILVMGLGVALLTLPAMGAKPAVVELCVFSGDVGSNDVAVEIGVSTTGWELLDPTTGQKTTLWLRQDLLLDTDGVVAYLDEGDYYGQARVLKKDGRFDFDFGDEECVSPTYGDTPPFWSDGDGLCPYALVILDGVYDRQADDVTWGAGSRVILVDYTLGRPCAVFPQPCIESGEYNVGFGPLSPLGVRAQFSTAGEEEPPPDPEPEKSYDACHDTVDNDGDGLVDDADPNCKRWYR